jgi:hypothetical protein
MMSKDIRKTTILEILANFWISRVNYFIDLDAEHKLGRG